MSLSSEQQKTLQEMQSIVASLDTKHCLSILQRYALALTLE
jgi:hypothetical protein